MKTIAERPTLEWLVTDEVNPEDVIDRKIVDTIRAACPADPHVAVAALWKALRRTLAHADLDTWQSLGCLMQDESREIESAIGALEFEVDVLDNLDYSLTFAAHAMHLNCPNLINTLPPDLRGEEEP